MGPDDSETVGFIDVGTNSIHLLVVRFYNGTAGTPVFQDKETVRLGQSLYAEGSISQEVIDKSAMVLSRFAGIARDMGPTGSWPWQNVPPGRPQTPRSS